MHLEPTAAPIICAVTDRHRACPDSRDQQAIAAVVAQARWAAEAGIEMIQVRERDLESAALADLVGAVLEAVRGSRTRVVVNDRVDVALAVGADGVHLRGDSFGCDRVRRIVPARFVIGRSVHAVDEARGTAGADFLIAGTVFATPSKPGRKDLLGCDGLHALAQAVAVPVLAIGGITADRVADVARAGAAGIAAIALFLGPAGPVPLGPIVAGIRREFDAGAALRSRR